jgi:hypothetical protein
MDGWQMSMKIKRLLILAAAASICGLSSGCGYSSKRPFPSDIETVHVEMLHSREFRRDLEFHLTEALIKRIEMDTPYRIANKEQADSIFSGEILEVRQSALGHQFTTGQPREMGASVVMRFRWVNQNTGEILAERPRFVHMDTYIPPVGESFTTGVAIRALDRMAERIVEAMETQW